mmetsp:Transcript_113656/g.352988  ORF Transcript_113656/g.352988 Transcript_113656/m.352988 type:complete len:277 (-) Transcript_113656:916-1746(-)
MPRSRCLHAGAVCDPARLGRPVLRLQSLLHGLPGLPRRGAHGRALRPRHRRGHERPLRGPGGHPNRGRWPGQVFWRPAPRGASGLGQRVPVLRRRRGAALPGGLRAGQPRDRAAGHGGGPGRRRRQLHERHGPGLGPQQHPRPRALRDVADAAVARHARLHALARGLRGVPVARAAGPAGAAGPGGLHGDGGAHGGGAGGGEAQHALGRPHALLRRRLHHRRLPRRLRRPRRGPGGQPMGAARRDRLRPLRVRGLRRLRHPCGLLRRVDSGAAAGA